MTIDPNADPDTYIVKSQVLDDHGYELPRINDAFDGKPYSFFYALSSQVNPKPQTPNPKPQTLNLKPSTRFLQRPYSFPMDAIAKVDVQNGKTVFFEGGGLSLGEAVFIQDPNDDKV